MVSPASRFLSLAALVALMLGAPEMALAQNGRIRGTVRDASGDALSGVTIRALGTAGVAHRATTGTDGSYTIANLTPGTYVVSAALPGLRTQSQANVRVSADAETVVDLVMQAVQLEAVTVTAMLREQRLADVPFRLRRQPNRRFAFAAPTTSKRWRPTSPDSASRTRPWPEPGGYPRSLIGSDRARPARRERRGGRVSR